jgi:hypothetical protein
MTKHSGLDELIRRKHLKEIVFVSWEESERGWGTRPDGCSLHLNANDARKFIDDYWKDMPCRVPDEYSRPAGKPTSAYVSSDLYKQVKENKLGIRVFAPQLREIYKKKFYYGHKVDGWRIRD